MSYCRVYLNRQNAAAHALVFAKVEEIVLEDTGQSLKWRHIHASSPDELCGILQWAGDQHGGQAKGMIPLLANCIFLNDASPFRFRPTFAKPGGANAPGTARPA